MKFSISFAAILLLLVANAYGYADWSQDQKPEKWFDNAKGNIDKFLKRKQNNNIAKNLILFLGDGMGITTVTAGRIHKGQLQNRNGEEEITNMEQMDTHGFAKVIFY
jgi:alkaline phosphatase